MATNNFSIGPSDGWVQIATAPKFVRVSNYPATQPYYLYAGATSPASTVIGVLMCHHPFKVNVTMTENLYARVVNPNANGKTDKIRLDVFTI